jgi:hypothetical protein
MDGGAREVFLAGASPAYDVTERGGDVVELEILLAHE